MKKEEITAEEKLISDIQSIVFSMLPANPHEKTIDEYVNTIYELIKEQNTIQKYDCLKCGDTGIIEGNIECPEGLPCNKCDTKAIKEQESQREAKEQREKFKEDIYKNLDNVDYEERSSYGVIDAISDVLTPTKGNEEKCNGNCGMNYCDDNGCIERKRHLVDSDLLKQGTENKPQEVKKIYRVDVCDLDHKIIDSINNVIAWTRSEAYSEVKSKLKNHTYWDATEIQIKGLKVDLPTEKSKLELAIEDQLKAKEEKLRCVNPKGCSCEDKSNGCYFLTNN